MTNFPDNMKFQKPWRPYQKRVLQNLEKHLSDNHLHIVAAPGSGKTILGLEVIRRLNQPTLILAPTLSIRDQWIDRLKSLFLPLESSEPAWITTNIKKPKLLTVSTYQALHCVLEGLKGEIDLAEIETEDVEPEKESHCPGKKTDVLAALKKAGIKTLVLDEAHHLRNEWWKSLWETYTSLNAPSTLALTATPPYDVLDVEWQRYIKICGEVDEEISVPDVMLEKILCPHQDYIYFSTPSPMEDKTIREFNDQVDQFYSEFVSNQEIINAFKQHPWILAPDQHLDPILSDPQYFSSLAIFLNHTTHNLPDNFYKIMGITKQKLMGFSLYWLEILLNGCLFNRDDFYLQFKPLLNSIRHRLSRIRCLQRGRISLIQPEKISRLLAGSVSKLNSISEIIKLEANALHSDLRAVILTDYIREYCLPPSPNKLNPLEQLGAAPIFEFLRREQIPGLKLGVLSGSLVIIPKDLVPALRAIVKQSSLDAKGLDISPLKHDPAYCAVDMKGENKHMMVQWITQLFTDGYLQVLVGTKSLLGEGWDAPCINTLVMASFVGTYMLSNQMRGRAIRTQPGHPEKTANIWHLVCIESPNRLGDDYYTLTRRFKAFIGVSTNENLIQNGIQRLGIGKPPFTAERLVQLNKMMCVQALERNALQKKWDQALKHGTKLVEKIHTKSSQLPRGFVFANTISAFFYQGILWGLAETAHYLLRLNLNVAVISTTLFFRNLFIIGGFLTLPICLKSFWLYFKHGSINSSMRQIGLVLLKTLIHMRALSKDVRFEVKADKDKAIPGAVSCFLVHGTNLDKSLFYKTFQEVLRPIENPRYLLVRYSFWSGYMRTDYHAVPAIIGAKKAYAKYFAAMWSRHVGKMKLIFTRSMEGRKLLLWARSHSLSSVFQETSDRLSCWQ